MSVVFTSKFAWSQKATVCWPVWGKACYLSISSVSSSSSLLTDDVRALPSAQKWASVLLSCTWELNYCGITHSPSITTHSVFLSPPVLWSSRSPRPLVCRFVFFSSSLPSFLRPLSHHFPPSVCCRVSRVSGWCAGIFSRTKTATHILSVTLSRGSAVV